MEKNRSARAFFGISLRGIAMGAADVVPGVSGGTVAFITGIYEELLETISGLRLSLIGVLRKEGIKATWKKANLSFLFALFVGIAIAIVTLANLITYLLEHHEQLLWGFFFGLVAASVWAVGKDVKKWTAGSVVAFIIGTFLAVWITSLPPLSAVDIPGFIFFAGMVAICAMILPGISGSFILLIIGAYHDVLHAVKSFDLKTIAIFGAGCVTGLLGFSRLLNWMYKRYTDLTVSLLTGFMLGSLQKLWPWQAKSQLLHTHSDGREDWLRVNVLPNEVEGDPQVLLVLLCLTAGCVLIIALSRFSKSH